MVWWAYIIVWVVSFFIPLIIGMLNASLDNDESSFPIMNPLLVSSLLSMFATLNCIFCAILFGLK